MKKTISIILFFSLYSCTINIIQTDTHGTATDVVDDTSSTNPTVSPNLNFTGL